MESRELDRRCAKMTDRDLDVACSHIVGWKAPKVNKGLQPKEIQTHLRHSSPVTTLGEYVQPISSDVAQAVERLDAMLTNGRVN